MQEKRLVLLKQEASREKKNNEVTKKNEISGKTKLALFNLENKLVEKFNIATEKGKERRRRVISVISWYYNLYLNYFIVPIGTAYV